MFALGVVPKVSHDPQKKLKEETVSSTDSATRSWPLSGPCATAAMRCSGSAVTDRVDL